MSKADAKSKDFQHGKIHYPFWFGGSASSLAAAVTHPLDLVKVRLQTQPRDGARKNMLQMVGHVFKGDGITGLYKGLSASILRQITYSTTRFGVYEELKERASTPTSKPSTAMNIVLSFTSGMMGGVVGNPADILNVRMQNDASLSADKRRNYKHAIDGLVRMVREEGIASVFRGVGPNSIRAGLMTAAQLASYDAFKPQILQRTNLGDGMVTHFTASIMAGFVATTVCSPVDVIKTRIMSAHTQEGIVSLVTSITAKEGLGWVWKGWVPSFTRLGPHTVATFMFLEQHKKVYRKLRGYEE